MSETRRFLRSSSVMVVLYAGSTGLSFLVGVLLARLLGTHGYGVYALAMTTATLVGMITEFGLPVLAMREVGTARSTGEWGELAGLVRWSDRVILALSLVLIVGTFVGYRLFAAGQDSAYLRTLLWAVGLVPFVAIGKLRSFILMALDRVVASQLPVMILRPLLFLGGCVAVAAATGGLTAERAMIAQVTAAAVVMVFVLWFFSAKRPPEYVAAIPQSSPRIWMLACVPMGLAEGMRLLQGQLGLLIVGALAGPAQAGLYRVADSVATIAALASSVVGTAATSMFSRMWAAGDRAGLERLALLCALAMCGGALVLGLPVALLGNWLFPTIFGAEFAGSAPVFVVLWIGLVAMSLGGLAFALANMIGHHVLTTQSFAIVALVNAVCAVVLVPQFGAIGGALATTAGNLAGVGYCAWRLRRLTGLNATVFNRSDLADIFSTVVRRARG